MATTIRTLGVCNRGGDCAGLNAVIRAVVRTAIYDYNWRWSALRTASTG